jgi:acyl-coenzyme A thioesterase PaaI-like protein
MGWVSDPAGTVSAMTEGIPIQDRFPPEYAHCFVCGPANPYGFQLASRWDGTAAVATFVPPQWFTGADPDTIPGGLTAALLDCHTAAAGAAAAAQRLGLGPQDRLPRVATARLEVDFRAPTPIRTDLTLRAVVVESEGRKTWVTGELSASGRVTAQAKALIITPKH